MKITIRKAGMYYFVKLTNTETHTSTSTKFNNLDSALEYVREMIV